MLEAAGMAFSLNFNPEAIAVGGAKLPEVEEAENPRVLFEERIAMLRELSKGLDGLYDAFLKTRVTSAWEGQVSTIRKWITSSQRKASEALVAVG
jgi:hypothetical protein